MAALVLGLVLDGCGSANVNAEPSARQGANPVTWAGALCAGLSEVVTGQAEVAKTEPSTPQGQKDALLKLADTTQHAFANTGSKLTQLGPPAITNGKQAQNSAVSFFTTSAATVSDDRAKLAALDTDDPNFTQKANVLVNANVGTAATHLRDVTSNGEMLAALDKAPECQRLLTAATH